MESNLILLTEIIRSPKTLKRLALALGLEIENPAHKKIIHEYAASVLMEVEKTAVSDKADFKEKKKDLSRCIPESIIQCMIDSARFKIKIDGRQLAHLVKYENKATLQIGYRGFIAKIREIIPSSDVSAFPVYEGDDLTISSDNGFDKYSHKRNNLFASEKELVGVVGVLYYKKDGREFQRVITMSKDEIGKIKGCAKQSFIWDKWYVEKAKVAVIKRLCKITFAEISSIQDLIEYDNKENFDIKKTIDIDDTAQLDEFTQQALADKTSEHDQVEETEPDTQEDFEDQHDPTYGGQYDPETGEVY